jgi:hypothetical protein
MINADGSGLQEVTYTTDGTMNTFGRIQSGRRTGPALLAALRAVIPQSKK